MELASAYFHKFAYLKRPFPKDHAAICLAWKCFVHKAF